MKFKAIGIGTLRQTLSAILILAIGMLPSACQVSSRSVTMDSLFNNAPKIDFSHWKVTLPIGAPLEVEPPEILNYATLPQLGPYMYNDYSDASVVFHATPNQTTKNTKYSRTELREQMEPGSNHKNWTFPQGGRMVGTLRMGSVSKDENDKYHKVIVMQIHGRLSNEQRVLIGKKDNDAPPILKIYWDKGKIRVKTKVLKDMGADEKTALQKGSWIDDEGFTFRERVEFEPFKLEVIASDGRLEVILNDKESKVYQSIHMQRWSVFENYFKAGNYLQTRDEGAFAKVKYYTLEVTH